MDTSIQEEGWEMLFMAGHIIAPGKSGILLKKVEGKIHIWYILSDICQRHC